MENHPFDLDKLLKDVVSMLSNKVDQQDVDLFYLSKPVRRIKLIKAISKLIDKQKKLVLEKEKMARSRCW